MLEVYAGFPSLVSPLGFHDIDIQPLAEEGEYVAKYRWDCTMLPTGAPYRNAYIGRFTVRDGRIAEFAEYFDPVVFLEALGSKIEEPHMSIAEPPVRSFDKVFIGGRWVAPSSDGTLDVVSPITEECSRRCRRARRRTSTPPSPPRAARSTRGRGRAWRRPSGRGAAAHRATRSTRAPAMRPRVHGRDRRAAVVSQAFHANATGDVGRRGDAARARRVRGAAGAGTAARP